MAPARLGLVRALRGRRRPVPPERLVISGGRAGLGGVVGIVLALVVVTLPVMAASAPPAAANGPNGSAARGSAANGSAANGAPAALDDRVIEQVLVKWAPQTDERTRDASLAALTPHLPTPAADRDGPGTVPVTATVDAVKVVPGHAPAVVAALADDPAVDLAEADRHITGAAPAATSTGDDLFAAQWALENTGQTLPAGATVDAATPGIDIRAVPAWQMSRGDPDVVVAVIDTMIDVEHPDLEGAVAGSYRHESLQDEAGPGKHGTGVASLIAARADDAYGITGVAPRTSILDIGVFTGAGLQPGGATIGAVLAGIEEAVAAGADVINASWVSREGSQLLREAVAESGLPVVAASGNDGQRLSAANRVFPASYDLPNVVAVTALAADGSVPAFANTGTAVVDVAAPGDAIVMALPDGHHGAAQGTSFAAPHVSGALALAAGIAPYATTAELVDAVIWTSRAQPNLAGLTRSGGRLDAEALVRGVQRPVCRPDRLSAPEFSDVAADATHASGIACLAGEGVVSGRGDGTFAPAAPVTRAQLASMLGRILLDAGVAVHADGSSFEDVDPDGVHAPAITALASAGIVEGDTQGRFRPQAPVTRGQMASLLVRTHDLLTEDASAPSRRWFDDTAASVHADSADRARDLGIARGVAARIYAPQVATERGQIASLLANLLDAVERHEPSVEDPDDAGPDGGDPASGDADGADTAAAADAVVTGD